jgi:hypothetical protein
MCHDHGWQATFFVTHESKMVNALKAEPQFEVGIHPNFVVGSTHGATPEEVIRHCLGLVPDATSMRSHGFVSSNALSTLVATRYPQLEVDTSVFLPFQSQIEPVRRYFGSVQTFLAILPTWLSDMACSQTPEWKWGGLPPKVDGTCLVNVHPIHVVLNSKDPRAYFRFKEVLGSTPLSEVSREDLSSFTNNRGDGVGTWLRQLLEECRPATPGKVTAYVRKWFQEKSHYPISA